MAVDAAEVVARGGAFEVVSSIGSTPYVGMFAGGPVDITVGYSSFAEEGDDLSVAELSAFLRGLRHVPVDDWRTALATAEVDPEVAAAESLFSPPLMDGPVDD
jgi:hypothetical protein